MDFIKYNKLFLRITIVLVLLAFLAIGIFGLNFSYEFKSGTVIEYSVKEGNAQDITDSQLMEKAFIDIQPGKITRTSTHLKFFFDPLTEDASKALTDKISTAFPNLDKISTDTVTEDSGINQTKNSAISVIVVCIAIIALLAYSFSGVPRPFNSYEFGIAAVLALLHDAIIVLGAFAVLGHYFKAEIDVNFIMALLLVICFSVHDTIVVFDRVRENLLQMKNKSYQDIVNLSLNETVGRSLKLTITAVLVLVSLLVWGANAYMWMIAALLIGMISGTYSSIFVATQLLLLIQEYKMKKVSE